MPKTVVSIIGKSKSGKTTLIEKLIAELKRRGYRVGTIKHHYHAGFEIDIPGKDTWRHAKAGSDVVVIAAPDRIATIRRLERELELDEIIASLPELDIVITEGFKRAGKPSIEVVRSERGLELVADPSQLIAVVSEVELSTPAPLFNWNDVSGIVDFIESTFKLKQT